MSSIVSPSLTTAVAAAGTNVGMMMDKMIPRAHNTESLLNVILSSPTADEGTNFARRPQRSRAQRRRTKAKRQRTPQRGHDPDIYWSKRLKLGGCSSTLKKTQRRLRLEAEAYLR